MRFDIFFSISQTPVAGFLPDEATMFRNFMAQVEAADRLGYEVAWLAESHLSSEVQKRTSQPVIPHWEGEVGLNVDLVQSATRIFARTKRIEVGSAIMNVLCNGGPVAAAERIAAFLAWHGLDPDETRRLHVGFAAGRFDFMNRAYGIGPRNALEQRLWPAIKGQVYKQAGEAFVRLISGEVLASDDLPALTLTRADLRTDEDWAFAQEHGATDALTLPPFFSFESLQIVPRELRRELLVLVAGSHDPAAQQRFNEFAPVRVFNLSITRPEVIDQTHERMAAAYHPSGGAWQRDYMPRTVFVFLNEQPGLSPEQRREAAREEAELALGAYWKALDGTLDPKKVNGAANNALIGDAEQVAAQILERFHPDDRLMLWFDFFNHDNERVIQNMEQFMNCVVPLVKQARA